MDAVARLRASTERALTKIRTRLRKVDAEFLAVGQALNALDTPEILDAYQVPSFAAFLELHGIAQTTARRAMTVAREFAPETAKALGVTKAFHLFQYANASDAPHSAQTLAKRNLRIGSAGTRVSDLSARQIENEVRLLKLAQGRASIPRISTRQRRLVRTFGTQFEERFGVDAKFRIDAKKKVLRIEVPLSELEE